MTGIIRRSSMHALWLAAAVSLAACAKKDDTATMAADTSTGAVMAPAAPATSMLSVGDIDIGRSLKGNEIGDKTDDFKPNETVHAVVHTDGSASNASVTARWTFQDGQVVDEKTETVSPMGAATHHFMVAKPSGWPKGKYTLHVLVNGAEQKTKDFEVK
ncbi:MAG: hypothetical protein WKG32_06800 [Gemmatimonadaceae bacterium]